MALVIVGICLEVTGAIITGWLLVRSWRSAGGIGFRDLLNRVSRRPPADDIPVSGPVYTDGPWTYVDVTVPEPPTDLIALLEDRIERLQLDLSLDNAEKDKRIRDVATQVEDLNRRTGEEADAQTRADTKIGALGLLVLIAGIIVHIIGVSVGAQ